MIELTGLRVIFVVQSCVAARRFPFRSIVKSVIERTTYAGVARCGTEAGEDVGEEDRRKVVARRSLSIATVATIRNNLSLCVEKNIGIDNHVNRRGVVQIARGSDRRLGDIHCHHRRLVYIHWYDARFVGYCQTFQCIDANDGVHRNVLVNEAGPLVVEGFGCLLVRTSDHYPPFLPSSRLLTRTLGSRIFTSDRQLISDFRLDRMLCQLCELRDIHLDASSNMLTLMSA